MVSNKIIIFVLVALMAVSTHGGVLSAAHALAAPLIGPAPLAAPVPYAHAVPYNIPPYVDRIDVQTRALAIPAPIGPIVPFPAAPLALPYAHLHAASLGLPHAHLHAAPLGLPHAHLHAAPLGLPHAHLHDDALGLPHAHLHAAAPLALPHAHLPAPVAPALAAPFGLTQGYAAAHAFAHGLPPLHLV